MKYFLSTFICFLISSPFISQDVDDFISVGEGYSNESYYSMETGEVSNAINTNWDIAFDASPIEINMNTFEVKGYSIKINPATNTRLKMYPHGTISDWNGLDTAGISSWPNLYNPENTWSKGAFDINLDESNVFDFGWGVYDPITHVLTGDSLYVIQLGDGAYKKVWIEKMELEEYFFKYADLDGSNEVSQSIAKADYSNRNYIYFSLSSNQVIDREPDADSWDLVFTRYVSEIIPDFFLTVTGTFSNKDIEVAQAEGISDPFDYEDFESEEFETDINVIGYDWKAFNESTFQWSIVDELCYFIKDHSSNVWRLTFSYFGGSSNGDIAFNKEPIAALSVDEYSPLSSISAFPNPSTDNFTLVFNNDASAAQIELVDITGKIVLSNTLVGNGLNVHTINVSVLTKGMYFLNIISEGHLKSVKLVVE